MEGEVVLPKLENKGEVAGTDTIGTMKNDDKGESPPAFPYLSYHDENDDLHHAL